MISGSAVTLTRSTVAEYRRTENHPPSGAGIDYIEIGSERLNPVNLVETARFVTMSHIVTPSPRLAAALPRGGIAGTRASVVHHGDYVQQQSLAASEPACDAIARRRSDRSALGHNHRQQYLREHSRTAWPCHDSPRRHDPETHHVLAIPPLWRRSPVDAEPITAIDVVLRGKMPLAATAAALSANMDPTQGLVERQHGQRRRRGDMGDGTLLRSIVSGNSAANGVASAHGIGCHCPSSSTIAPTQPR